MIDKVKGQITNSFASRPRWTWIRTTIILVLLLSLVALVWFTHTSKHRGWATRKGIGYVNALAADARGGVWVAYQAREVVGFDPGSDARITLPQNPEPASDTVTTLAIDRDARMWLGTRSGAIHTANASGQWITYQPVPSQKPDWVKKLVIDAQRQVWVGAWSGLGLIEPQKQATTYSFESSGLGRATFNGVTTDRRGRVWVLSNHRLMKLDADGNWETHAKTDGMRLAIDTQSQPWVGIYEGVSLLGHDGNWTTYNLRELGDREEGIDIVALVADEKNRVWVGSGPQGLFMFNPSAGWTNYNTSNSGLVDDWVTALAIDGQGRVWVGTPRGLSVLNPDIAPSPQDIQTGATARTVLITVGVLGIGVLALLTVASTSSARAWNRSLRHSLCGFVGWFVLSPVFWAVFLGGLEVDGRSLGEGAIILFPLRNSDNSDENSDTSEALGVKYDVVIVGAGTGGIAAAIQAARLGVSVALVEETDWIGGQMTAASVNLMDEGGFNNDSGFYIEFINRAKAYYLALGKTMDTHGFRSKSRSIEPSVGKDILLSMIQDESNIDLYLRTRVDEVFSEFYSEDLSIPLVKGVRAIRVREDGISQVIYFGSQILIDATEYGDIIALSPARYRIANDTSDNIDSLKCVQQTTYVAVMKKYTDGVPPELVLPSAPPGYSTITPYFLRKLITDGVDWREEGKYGEFPMNWLSHIAYRSMPNTTDLDSPNYDNQVYENITKTSINMLNDFDYTAGALEDSAIRQSTNCAAKLRTLQFLYYVQEALQENEWAIANTEGFDTPYNIEENLCDDIPQEFKQIERHLPVIPYIRESRRIIGLSTLTGRDIRREAHHAVAPNLFTDSVAVGDYVTDLHDCVTADTLELDLEGPEDLLPYCGPFQIPLGVFIPEGTDGFLAAEKNISLSRVASGASRLQPITMHTGQAAGVIAALAIKQGVQPRALSPISVQWELLKADTRLGVYKFSDVPMTSPLWRDIELVSVYKIFLGYPDGRFGVADAITRDQAAAVLARAFNLDLENPPTIPTFDDVPINHWAYNYIEAVYASNITSGCSSSPKLFCPDASTKRDQMAFMIMRGLGLDPNTGSSVPHYDDVPVGYWAFKPIQLITDLGLIEPCQTSPKLFCPSDDATRGIAAQIIARTLLHSN